MSTPTNLNSPPSSPFLLMKEDQQFHFFLGPLQHQPTSSSSSSPILSNITQDQTASHLPQPQHKVDMCIGHGGSSDHQAESSSSSVQEQSKIKISSPSSGNSNFARTCSDCNTTKTPLWRSGPQGPKSLCNACGIRQRKARRAMAAAATNAVALAPNNSTIRAKNKEKKSQKSSTKQLKKPFKLHGAAQVGDHQKIVSFEDFALRLSKNLSVQRAFPKDEEDAAVLLMALSCGLIL